MNEYLQANLKLWNAWAALHAGMRSEEYSYNIDAFKAGRSTLYQLDIDEVGDVAGKSLLHLQCHIGLDTLSWARRGAQVTGADFSDTAIAVAQQVNDELGLGGRFVRSNLYDLPEALNEQFDVVYTSYGVLSWLPDIPRWGQIVGQFLKPGGVFYIAEIHPFLYVFDERNSGNISELRVSYPYFHQPEPTQWPVEGSYADPTAKIGPLTEYGWFFSLSDVINALIDAGLTIEFVREYPFCCFKALSFLKRHDDGWWYPPEGQHLLPMTFTLRAHK